ncbi:LuxR C-terminal-related transcriptional regulator [Streptomyces sp. NPDC001902]
MNTIAEYKLHPPARPRQFVPRPRLLRRLDAAVEPVVVVSAPPGAGKSVLLADWARTLEARDRQVAWLELDAYDNTPARLWAGVLAALRPFRPGLPTPPPAGAWTLEAWVEDLLPRILAAPAGGSPLTLVLDGVDWLTDQAALRCLGDFLTALPAGMRAVLATRHLPGAPVPALRARGLAADLAADELRFTPDEAAALLACLSGGPVDERRVRELYHLTEGWAAGLCMLGRTRAGDAAGARPGGPAVDGARAVADYLGTEVLDRLTTEQRAFLLRTSVLDELSPESCRAVTGSDRAGVLLRDLARTVQLLVPSGTAPGAYRHHPALRALLAAVLATEQPGGAAALHHAAGHWYGERRRTTPAVRHFVEAGDIPGALTAVLQAWEETLAAGRTADVARWLRMLPARAVRADARLCVVAAMTALCEGDPEAAERWLDVAKARPCGPGTVGEGGTVAQAAAVARALVRCLRGESAAQVRLDGADVRRPAALTAWRALACVAQGTALLWQGRTQEADAHLAEAVRDAHGARHSLVLVRALGSRALCAYLDGNRERARTLVEQALDTARAEGLTGHFAAAPAHLCHAGLLVEDLARTDAAEALSGAARAMTATVHGGEPHLWALAGVVASGLPRGVRGAVPVSVPEEGGAVPEVLGGLLARLGTARPGPAAAGAGAVPRAQDLSPGERRILRALCGPLTLREIAAELHVSRNTVKTQVSSLFRKLDAHSRSGAVARARECGVLHPGPGTSYEASCRRA